MNKADLFAWAMVIGSLFGTGFVLGALFMRGAYSRGVQYQRDASTSTHTVKFTADTLEASAAVDDLIRKALELNGVLQATSDLRASIDARHAEGQQRRSPTIFDGPTFSTCDMGTNRSNDC